MIGALSSSYLTVRAARANASCSGSTEGDRSHLLDRVRQSRQLLGQMFDAVMTLAEWILHPWRRVSILAIRLSATIMPFEQTSRKTGHEAVTTAAVMRVEEDDFRGTSPTVMVCESWRSRSRCLV